MGTKNYSQLFTQGSQRIYSLEELGENITKTNEITKILKNVSQNLEVLVFSCIFIFVNTYKKHNKVIYLMQYHIIWCPKYRRSILTGALKERTEEIIKEVVYERNGEIIAMEIMPDHIHLFVGMKPKETPHRFVKALKGRTSNYLRKEFPELLKMPTLWSRSYFLSTVGNVSGKTVKEYIEQQWTKTTK